MLYTVISVYDIFTKGEEPSRFKNISCGKVEYMMQGKNKVVKSLFSTDPAAYLDKRYQPGSRLV